VRVIFLSSVLVILLLGSVAGRAEPLKILAGQIPHVFHQQTPGPHNLFFEQVVRPSVGNHEVKFLSYRRAMRDFAERRADCLYIAIDNIDDYPIDRVDRNHIRFSEPINSIGLRLYTRPGDAPVTAYQDLKDKVIVGAGSHLKMLEPHVGLDWGITTLVVETEVKAFELLDKHRVDVVVSVDFDTRLFEQAHNRGPYSYDKNLVLAAWDEVMTCWHSENTAVVLSRVNKAIAEARATGLTASIFSAD